MSLDRPALFRTQVRAFLRAGEGRELMLMVPMVSAASEMDAIHALIRKELALLAHKGLPPPKAIKIGAMIEVPSLLFELDALMPRVDFASVGSNDLMQFLFACDRGAPHMADAYDTLSPVMLNVVRQVIEKAQAHGVEVSFCGEMARQPLDALALIGLGLRSLSASASSIGPLKAMIRSVQIQEIEEYVAQLAASQETSIRGALAAYARDRGIAV
jgi:phosphotransferase system enzyme I (PtsP)